MPKGRSPRRARASGGSSPLGGAGSPSGSRGTVPLSRPPTGAPRRAPSMEDVTERWIDLDGLVNMRDLGGLPTRDGGAVVQRRLIRSDNLQDLTDADVRRVV